MWMFLRPVIWSAPVLAVIASAAQSQVFEHPGGLHSLQEIESVRARIAASDEPWLSACTALLRQVEESLPRAPGAVADFNVPGFYKDAEGHRSALAALARDGWTAYACAVAYQLTPGDAGIPYAQKAIETLDAWAAINTQASGDDGSLVMAYAGVSLVFAAELMHDYDKWTSTQRERFRQWVEGVFLPVCRRIAYRSNNWGDWGLLGSIAAHHFLDDQSGVDNDIASIRLKIPDVIHTDGSMPHETRRGKRGLWYTYFSLAPMTAACQIAANARGVDLFRHKGPNGVGIEDALDYLFHHCKHPEKWPHHTEDDLIPAAPDRWPGNLFEAMRHIYGEKEYGDWVRGAHPIMVFGHHYAWAFPTLLHPQPPATQVAD